MYFYDLETTFLAKGGKRTQQQILEVGIVRGRKSFSALVDPTMGKPILSTLEELGQHPKRSVRFWTKLLIEKKLLNSAVKRKPFEIQAKYIDSVRKDFMHPEDALKNMLKFDYMVDSGTWVAHNGKCFDNIIMRAHFEKFGIKHNINFKDSLPEIRKLQLPSHSLGYVYKHLFKQPFRCHHALDDAKALQRVCNHLSILKNTETVRLTTLDGVGVKTEKVLKESGIHTVQDLVRWYTKGEKWTFKTHRNLYDSLYKQIKGIRHY